MVHLPNNSCKQYTSAYATKAIWLFAINDVHIAKIVNLEVFGKHIKYPSNHEMTDKYATYATNLDLT